MFDAVELDLMERQAEIAGIRVKDIKPDTTCYTCGRQWNDSLVSSVTPTPSARCPFEYEH